MHVCSGNEVAFSELFGAICRYGIPDRHFLYYAAVASVAFPKVINM